ncbi:MAG: Ig-like domain-containing protein, partial [Candidatus Hodarchaeales archaeon]
PENESIINGDPIAVASSSSGDDRYYAEKFVEFVMSPEAQGLWLHPDISRLPIISGAFDHPYGGIPRPDIEANWESAKAGGGIDFNETLALEIYDSVIWYFHATLTEVSEQLYSAWQFIVDAYNNNEISEEEFRSLTREMTAPLISLEEAKIIEKEIQEDPNIKDSYVLQWKTEAISRYQAIEAKVNSEKGDDNNDGSYFDEFSVEITSPTNGSVVVGVTDIEATSVDYGDWSFLYGVKNLEFYVDNELLDNQTAPESIGDGQSVWVTEWNTTKYSEGPHTLKVISKEYTGRETQFQSIVYVNIIKELPGLSITSPSDGTTVNETVTIAVSASENEDFNIGYITIEVSGSAGQVLFQNITTGFSSISLEWNTIASENGVYTITVTAYYTSGNTQSKQVSVTVNNEKEATTTWRPAPGFEGISLLFALIAILGISIKSRKRQ